MEIPIISGHGRSTTMFHEEGKDEDDGDGGEEESSRWGSWVVSIEERAKTVDPCVEETVWKKTTIYRLPVFARELNPKAFTPQVVSLGPFHHGSAHLAPMEEHKDRALVHFLKRAGRPLADYEKALLMNSGDGDGDGVPPCSLLQQLQDCYSGLDREKWIRGRDDFLKLMIVDGCFLLEVIRITTCAHTLKDYGHSDPLFSNHGIVHIMPYIRRDMLMLENQLPLLLIKILLAVEDGKTSLHDVADHTVNSLVLNFCAQGAESPPGECLGRHPLDIFRRNMLRGQDRIVGSKAPPPRRAGAPVVRPAAELYEAGVRFKRSRSRSLRDIKFEGGVLFLPPIVVDDATECTFLNLVAFEHLHVDAGNDVTSYLSFMDEVVDTAEDVRLLRSRGIMDNGLGSDKEVAKLFNRISKETTLDPQCVLGDVLGQLNRFYEQKWHKWWANLMLTYFRNPWSFISVFAATLLLLLTIGQLVYGALQYYSQIDDQTPSAAPPPPPSPPPLPHR